MKRTFLRGSTVPRAKPSLSSRPAAPPRRAAPPAPPRSAKPAKPPTRRRIAHIVDESGSSLVDVLDNLLSKGVVLNADLILALANVDLIYVRLSALLVAADRLLPADDGR